MIDVDTDKVLVKLYELNEDNNWADKCTGYLFFYVIESDDDTLPTYKFVISTDGDAENILHQFDLDTRAVYELQQDTLISWESEGVEYALSFQSADACQITFETIQKSLRLSDGENSSDNNLQGSDFSENKSDDIPNIPDLTYENLQVISSLFADISNNTTLRDRINNVVEDCSYFSKLVSIFHKCEDLDDQEGLRNIYTIIKGMFSLGRFVVFESLVRGENLMEIIGMLEYNPYLSERIEHRKLLESAKLNEIIPFSNPDLRELITQTHRLQYLYDLMAPTPAMLDDRATFFASLIYYRKSEIVEAIFEDQAFLSEVFSSLGKDATESTVKESLLKLINEICNFSKVLQLDQKKNFMNKLLDFDVLACIDSIKDLPGDSVANYILEVLFRISESNTDIVRKGLVGAMERGSNIFEYLCDKLILNPGITIGILAHQVFINILDQGDSSTPDKESIDLMEAFLGKFYDGPIDILMKPLVDYCSNTPLVEKSYKLALGVENILEILSVCIANHTYHIKNYIYRHDLLKLISNLVVSKHAFITHGSIRIIRSVLAANDKFYTTTITKDVIMDKFLDGILYKFNNDTMLNSSLIDLFEHLNISDNKGIILDLVERRRSDLTSINYVPTFKKLIEESEKIGERSSSMLKSSFLIRPRELFSHFGKSIPEDEAENKWFESDDSLKNGSNDDAYFELKNGTNGDISNMSHIHVEDEPEFPILKSKFDVDDDSITLKPKIVKNSLFVCLKRQKSQSPENTVVTKTTINGPLVDYSDDDNEENIPPSESCVVDINELIEVPTSKNRKC